MNIDTQKLIEARVESGLTLEEIAEKTGISRATIWRMEKRIRRPQGKTLSKLCKLYGKVPSDFLKVVNE